MPVLASAGFTETEVRDWPPELIAARVEAVEQQANGRLALSLMGNFFGAAAANGSHDAVESLQELVAQLSGDEEASLDAHLLNPDAQTDFNALRKVAQPVHKEDSDAREGG